MYSQELTNIQSHGEYATTQCTIFIYCTIDYTSLHIASFLIITRPLPFLLRMLYSQTTLFHLPHLNHSIIQELPHINSQIATISHCIAFHLSCNTSPFGCNLPFHRLPLLPSWNTPLSTATPPGCNSLLSAATPPTTTPLHKLQLLVSTLYSQLQYLQVATPSYCNTLLPATTPPGYNTTTPTSWSVITLLLSLARTLSSLLSCTTHWQLKLSSSNFHATSMAAPLLSTLVYIAPFPLSRAPLLLSPTFFPHRSAFYSSNRVPSFLLTWSTTSLQLCHSSSFERVLFSSTIPLPWIPSTTLRFLICFFFHVFYQPLHIHEFQ